MTIKVLALGDIVGKIGRQTVKKFLPDIRREYNIDLVVAQAENLAHGIGVTRTSLEDVRSAGIDIFTGGNHIWKKQGRELLADPAMRLIRPANYADAPGAGWTEFAVQSGQHAVPVALINLQGQAFMKESVDNPFRMLNVILDRLAKDPGINNLGAIILDFHAEATSEKVAMGWHGAGRLSAVWGTHTQVPTMECRVLPGGTGFVADLGMSGARDGVIGVAKEGVISSFLTGLPIEHEIPESGPVAFNACLFEIDSQTRRCVRAERIDRFGEID